MAVDTKIGKTRILVVEDEWIIANDIQRSLLEMSYDVIGIASSGEEAVKRALQEKPDLILMDIVLQGEMDGIAASTEIHGLLDIPIIYLTAYADDGIFQRAKASGPFGYLIKPFEEKDLRVTIEMALYKHRLEADLRRSERMFRGLMEHAADAFILHDMQGQVVNANGFACSMLGYSRDELVGMNIRDIVSGVPEERLKGIVEGLEPGMPVTLELDYLMRGGDRLPVEVRLGLLQDTGEKLVLALARDISLRKKDEAEKEKLIAELQEALHSVKAMKSMMPICVSRMNFRNDDELKVQITEHYKAIMKDGVCQKCLSARG